MKSVKFLKKIYFPLILLSAALCASLFSDSTHTVEKGETLYAISRKYQITVAELRAANNMSENDVLKAGQTLTIPSADISNAAALTGAAVVGNQISLSTQKTKPYIAQKGETFYGIARNHGISVSELFALNDLGNDAVLKAGQSLLVPDNDVASAGVSQPDTVKETAGSAKEGEVLPDLKSVDPRKYSDITNIDSQLVWPVKNPKVVRVNGKVSGVQLSAAKDEVVTAIMSGTVMYCGVYRGFGQIVFVQSKTGLIYAYTGLGAVYVQKGDYVVSGTQLGAVGIDTISNQPQMTLMVFQNGAPIDPATAPRG